MSKIKDVVIDDLNNKLQNELNFEIPFDNTIDTSNNIVPKNKSNEEIKEHYSDLIRILSMFNKFINTVSIKCISECLTEDDLTNMDYFYSRYKNILITKMRNTDNPIISKNNNYDTKLSNNAELLKQLLNNIKDENGQPYFSEEFLKQKYLSKF